MLIIQSAQNPSFKFIKNILSNYKDYPLDYCVEGLRSAQLFSSSSFYKLEAWYMTEEVYKDLPDFIIPSSTIYVLKDNLFKSIARSVSPSGLLGHFKLKKNVLEGFDEPTFVLYNISDPGNLGTIIRTAVALGRREIILIDGAYPNSYKVIQSSAGTIAHIRIWRVTWEEFIKNKAMIPLYGLDMNGEDIMNYEWNGFKECFLLIGNEANGIPDTIKSSIDKYISIPMETICESLNAAVAASVAGYRIWKI
jgi:TrmH family RNA methyltransferase